MLSSRLPNESIPIPMRWWFVEYRYPSGAFTYREVFDTRSKEELNMLVSSHFTTLLGITMGRENVPHVPPSTDVRWLLTFYPEDEEHGASVAASAYRDSIPHSRFPWTPEELQALVRAMQST